MFYLNIPNRLKIHGKLDENGYFKEDLTFYFYNNCISKCFYSNK